MQNPGFHHVLVALDGSKESELSLAPAEKVVCLNGKLTLVHVAEDLLNSHQLPEGSDGDEYTEKQIGPIRDYLKSASELISRPDVKVETVVASGHPADAILSLSAELEVDAIALSNHLRSPLRRALKGSTTQYLLAKSEVPLIVVHDE